MRKIFQYTSIFILIISVLHSARTFGQDKTEYSKTIETADTYFAKGDYINAKASYQYASQLMPSEQYPKDRIQETLGKIKQQMEKNNIYTAGIMVADEYYKNKNWLSALKAYEEALVILPGDKYATQKAGEITQLMDQSKLNEQKYLSAVVEGDKFMNSGEYQKALDQYNLASSLRPEESYPNEKAVEAQGLIIKQKMVADEFGKAMQAGDNFSARGKYAEAVAEYERALQLKPGDAKAKTALDSSKLLKEKSDAYARIIQEGDNFYIEKKFAEARTRYVEANTINPTDEYPQRMIEKVDIAMQDIKDASPSDYEIAIARADRYYNEQDYEKAMAEYKNALNIEPDGQYAKKRIEDINADLKLRQITEDAYVQSIAKGDNLFKEKRYEEALVEYKNSLNYKPLEKYPEVKMDEINTILANLQSKKELYNRTIQGADKLFFADDYADARIQYRKAEAMFPDDPYPKNQITMINEILGERDTNIKIVTDADKKVFEVNQGEVTALIRHDYEIYMFRGDSLTSMGKLTEALVEYNTALNLLPSEQSAIDKINQTNARLDQIQAAEIEQKKQQELAAKQAEEKKYNDVLSKADAFFVEENYPEALAFYQQAVALNPADTYPKAQISEINAKVADIAAKEAETKQLAEKQAALDQQYAEALSRAEVFYAAADYTNAIAVYQSAQAIKPSETQPQVKINEINAKVAEIAAKEAEARELAEKLAALDRQYNETVSNADQLFAEGKYNEALAAYQQSSALNPGESYPKDKMTLVNEKLREIADQEALDKQYTETIGKADTYFAAADYTNALSSYQSALTLKPNEPGPQAKIREINDKLGEIAAREALEKQYTEAISFADKHFAAGDYSNASLEYKKAQALKPEVQYAQSRIKEIDGIIAEQKRIKAIEATYSAAITRADEAHKKGEYQQASQALEEALNAKPGDEFATAKINEVNQAIKALEIKKQDDYTLAILSADNYFSQQKYEMAKMEYERASVLKPEEVYPLDQMKMVNEALQKQRQIVQEEYDKAVADADKFYAGKIYDNAIEAYRLAAELKPAEEYPKEMVKRILKLISERAIVQINKDPVLVKDNTTQKFTFIPVPVKDRKSNYIFFKARSTAPQNYKVIISFGQDQVKNGGIVVKVPKGADINDYIVRISAQYKWFSEDNNWITFYPEGADLEVSLIQISYSD